MRILSKAATCTAILLVIFAATLQAFAQSDPDKSLSPYFHVSGDPAVDSLPLKDTKVEVVISGVIADVRVVQKYQNTGTRAVNATYVFPASTRAAVYGMQMRIRDELIRAKIKEREQAKQEYEQAKKEGKNAALLEQDRPNIFTMNLANIMPQDEIEIELRYTELIIPTDGVYQFVYPTVVGPRYGSEGNTQGAAPRTTSSKQPTGSFQISTNLYAGLPINEFRSTSHHLEAEWVNPANARMQLSDPDGKNANRDFVLRYRLSGEQINSGLLLYQGQDENFFLYMAQPPTTVKPDEIPPREYTFVVDVSGSMEGFPLNTSKRLLQELIGALRPTDFFNVVLFSGDSTLLSNEPLPANRENLEKALFLIDQQRGSGGTELLQAMQQAMASPRQANMSRSIIVITDGYISAEKELFDYIRQNLGNTNVFSFGIGSSVNRYLIEGVAKAGMGEPFVILNEEEAVLTAGKFREYIENPVLAGVKITTDGFETYDVQPMNQPDLFARRPIIMFGKWRGTPSGTVTLSGWTGKGEYSSTVDVGNFAVSEDNRAIQYLWARTKIAELSDYGSNRPDEARRKEITDLGLKYNLLTQYTSFIAVREKIVNPNADASDVNQAVPLPDGVMEMGVGSEPELMLMLLIAAIAGVVGLLRRYRTALQFAWRPAK